MFKKEIDEINTRIKDLLSNPQKNKIIIAIDGMTGSGKTTLAQELSQLYDKLDKNSDYKITKAELYKAYKEAEIPVTSEELDGVIKSIDFDNNGNVDYEEFIRMCIPKERLFTEANLENAFSLFDKEKKGFITPAEIIDFIHAKKTVKNDDFEQKIKNEILDIADEIIDVEEFKAMMLTMANSD